MRKPPRFLLDEMLGKLARELRALGYDAEYRKHVDDDALLAEALATDRWLVTRDKQLADRAGDQGFLLTARDPLDQLSSLVEGLALGLGEEAFLSRCLVCNTSLELVEAPERVPDAVQDDPHRRCPSCDRVYWEGTHVRDMRDRLGRYIEPNQGEDG